MNDFKKLAHDAQRQLTARAATLMLMGVQETIDTDVCNVLEDMSFEFAGVKVAFDKKHPYNAEEVTAAIAKLDAMIEEYYMRAKFAIEVVETWRGR